jgi:hypothetical protein
VLDLTRAEVWARVHGALDALLREAPIGYLKWDMNRDLVAAGRDQVLATYALLDRLQADHPALEIESCASGSARADWGVLARTQHVWTSDCTDALERLRIQRGASRRLPPEVMGAHVSASPNHQTGRRHTLAFRAAVALPYHFGIELDPLTLDDAERKELAGWIALHKRLRPLLHAGLHVAADPIDGRTLAGVVAPDAEHAVYLIAQEADRARPHPAPLRLPGLRPDLLPAAHPRAAAPGGQALGHAPRPVCRGRRRRRPHAGSCRLRAAAHAAGDGGHPRTAPGGPNGRGRAAWRAQVVRPGRCHQGHRPRHRPRRVLRVRWAVRLRQIDAAAADRRA